MCFCFDNKMAQYVSLDVANYNINYSLMGPQNSKNICICCLTENGPLISLSICKHINILENLLEFKLEYTHTQICGFCHNFIKKIELFQQQVQECHTILSSQTQQLKVNRKLHKLRNSDIEISSTINSEPIVFEIKNENARVSNAEDNQYIVGNIMTEVKIEHDSDFEIDVPLSQIKNEIKKKDKVKRGRVEKGPQPRDKYEGKIKIVILTQEEMIAEREKDAIKESYLKLRFKCEYCITGFDHELTLTDHMEKRHKVRQGSFVCDICKSVLSTETSYKEHSKRHLRRYECQICGKRNHSIYSIIKHYNEQHGDGDSKINTQFTCQECGFVSECQRSYRYHKDKHKEKPQCNICGNTFVNNTGLKTHMLTVHKKSNRVYSCDACNKVYNAKSGLLAHCASAHGAGGGAYCAQCRLHFRTAHNLTHHLRTHSRHVGDQHYRFICDECGSKFLTKGLLHEHINWVHLKRTNHKCDKCSKMFKNGSALKKHKNYVHEKKRPPRDKICDHCGRGFTTLTILREHIRTHTGERPLKCVHCPATFGQSAALYTHNRLLHAHTRLAAAQTRDGTH